VKRPVFAANWKMNHGPTEARAFLRTFLSRYKKRTDRTVIIIPPAISVTTVAAGLARRTDILLGVQNIHSQPKGAFTGEASAAMAFDAGARIALIGHSERRHVFGETDAATALKCRLALDNDLAPIVCVGETIDQRNAGSTEETILRQLRAALAPVSADEFSRILVAYEPVWAIGTGRNATPDDAAKEHAVLRAELGIRCGSTKVAAGIPILYGGSVNASNAAGLLAASGVDGLLVGGASLDATTWSDLVST